MVDLTSSSAVIPQQRLSGPGSVSGPPPMWARAERVHLLALDIDRLDRQQVIDTIFGSLDRGEGGWLVTPNLDILRKAHVDPELRLVFSRASLLVADGAPVEWAARLAGKPIPGRFPGADMFWVLCAEAAARGRTMLLLGGRPTAAEQAAERLRNEYPGLAVHHHFPPMGFEHDAREMEAIRGRIRELEPDLVVVALGPPKQERLMALLGPEFPKTWFFGFGATVDFAAGLVPRAPRWLRNSGGEWVYRLMMEPRRLSKRYLVEGIPFFVRLMVWAAASRTSPAGPRTAAVPGQRAV